MVGTGALNYAWIANQSANHLGVVQLTGSLTSYINLSTSTGPNSAGATLPTIGGPGNFAYGNAQQGWTFEIVCLFPSPNGGWPKVFALGNTAGADDIMMSFNANDGTGVGAQMYSNSTLYPNFQYAFAEFLTPLANTWYRQTALQTA